MRGIAESVAIERVLEKCKEKNLEFNGWIDGKWIGTQRTMLILKCKKHEHEWSSTRYNNFIYNNHGCVSCGRERLSKKLSSNTKEFLEKLKMIHGDKYDYSEVIYSGVFTKVKVLCNNRDSITNEIHGPFMIRPSCLLSSMGCPKCSGKYRYNTNTWVEKVRIIHGDKYDYSKVNYINDRIKVCIICKEHGEFWQRPNGHISKGSGCPKCSKNKKITSEEWVKEASETHNNKYDYSLVNYINSSTKVEIICPKHGSFKQVAYYHRQGSGCPRCKESKLEKEVRRILIKNNIDFISQHTFVWLKNSRTNYNLYLDFYLPEYNITIECQGKQHFEQSAFGSKKLCKFRLFEIIQYRDQLKKQLCEENNIRVHYINYSDNIEDKLNEILKIHEL